MDYRSFTKYLFISSLFLNVLLSQTATVKGVIKDSGTEKPLVGANVFIKETSLGTATIDNGSYKISNVNPGTYILKHHQTTPFGASLLRSRLLKIIDKTSQVKVTTYLQSQT